MQIRVQLPDIFAEFWLRLRYTSPLSAKGLLHIIYHKRFENLNPPILVSSERYNFLSIHISFISIFAVVREIAAKELQIRVQLPDIFAEFWFSSRYTGLYPAQRMLYIFKPKISENYLNLEILVSSKEQYMFLYPYINFLSIFAVVGK